MITGGNNQSAPITQQLAQPLQVNVTDTTGAALPGASVTFTDDPTNGGTFLPGSVTTIMATTDASGNATATFVLGSTPATYSVNATVTGTSVTLATPFSEVGTNLPASIKVVASTNGQTGVVSAALPLDLAAKVTDGGGNPLGGVQVDFAATLGSAGVLGSFPASSAITGSDGIAHLTFTLGAATGTYGATVTVHTNTGLTDTFTETAANATPTFLKIVSGTPQNGRAGAPLINALAVQVSDQIGNPFPNPSLTFTVTAPGGSLGTVSSGALAGTTIDIVGTSGGLGIVNFTLSSTAGTNTVTAQGKGVALTPPSVTFTATGLISDSVTVVSGDNQTGNAGAVLTDPLVVVVKAGGTPVPGETVTFTPTAPATKGSFDQGGVYVTDALGQAHARFTLSTTVGTNTAQAAVAGVAGTANFINETGIAGVAFNIIPISGDFQSTQAGLAEPLPLVVEVVDVNGNAVANSPVTFAGPAGSSLTVTSTNTDNNGQASTVFTTPANTVTSYTVTATATTPNASYGFTEDTTTLPTAIWKSPGPFGSAIPPYPPSGDNQVDVVTAILQPFVVVVTDVNNLPVEGVPVTFTIHTNAGAFFSIDPVTGLPQLTTTVLTDTNGVAQGTVTLGKTPGQIQVTYAASDAGGNPLAFKDNPASFSATSLEPTNIDYFKVGGVDLSGNNQVGITNTAIKPFIAVVTDANGVPVPGLAVNWVIFSGGGVLSQNQSLTDSNGQAQTTLTFGASAGTTVVNATAADPATSALLLANGGPGTTLPFTATAALGVSFWVPSTFATNTAPTSLVLGTTPGGASSLVAGDSTVAKVSVLAEDGNGGFNGKRDFTLPSNPVGVVTGSFRGAAQPANGFDIATVSAAGGKHGRGLVTILLADGKGGYLAPVKLTAGKGCTGIAIGDLNGDGLPDLVVSNGGNGAGGNSVSVFMNQLGNPGTFVLTNTVAVSKNPQAVIIASVGNHASPDIITASTSNNSVSVVFNTTPGGTPHPSIPTLTKQPDVTVTGASGLAAGALTTAGPTDLVVASAAQNNITILKNSGSGTFTATANSPLATGTTPTSPQIGNLASGGQADIAVANKGDGTVSVFLSDNGNARTYLKRVDYVTGTSPSAVLVTKTRTGPNPNDLVVANSGDNDVANLLGLGSGVFTSRIIVTTGAGPNAVATTDLNGDGHPDLIVANSGAGTVSAFVQDQRGGFSIQTSINLGGASSPAGVATGLFNADANQDVAIVCSGTAQLVVEFGNGAGGFPTNKVISTGTAGTSKPVSVVAADFNNDGHLDLAVADAGTNQVLVFFGDGTGNFTAQPSLTTGAAVPTIIAAGTFKNTAGFPSIAVTCPGSNQVLLFLNDGTGAFAAGVALPGVPANGAPAGIGVALVNNDANPDLVVGLAGTGQILVDLGDGTGSAYPSQTTYATGAGASGIVTDDFLNQGSPAVVSMNSTAGTITALLGSKAGTLTAANTFASGTTPVAGVAGDFTGDGRDDLAVANRGGKVAILIQR